MGIVSINNLNFMYHDGHVALDNISLDVERGQRLAIIGPNGAGKSTLLLHLNGILQGDGKIDIDGLKISKKTIGEVRKKVGLVFQDPNDQLFCPTVRDDVGYGPLYFDMSKDERESLTKQSLESVEMLDCIDRPSHHLSMGEKRRVSLAAVLACKPEILAMDEPAASLDPKRKKWLVDFIKKNDRTIIIATHDLRLAYNTCDRCVLMNKGKIVADGNISDILSDSQLLLSNDLEPADFVISNTK